MKASPQSHGRVTAIVFLALLSPLLVAHAALSKSAPPARAALTNDAATNIPQSVFIIPSNVREGRDPFFPDSIRPYNSGPVKTNTPTGAVTLVLNGVSGTAERRLVMINGRTMAEGETSEVPTPGGRYKVRCLEIKDESVIIEIGGERRELHLRRGL